MVVIARLSMTEELLFTKHAYKRLLHSDTLCATLKIVNIAPGLKVSGGLRNEKKLLIMTFFFIIDSDGCA